MPKWITIKALMQPQEAHIVKTKLESEGIVVILKDELTAQVANHVFNAIDGVKLQVQEHDFQKATQLLAESGYIDAQIPENKTLKHFDRLTSTKPFIGKLPLEARIVLLVALVILLISIPILFLV